MTFLHPGWLVGALLACAACLWTWRRYDARQRAALAAFVSPRLGDQLTRSISQTRRGVKRALFAAAVALAFVALAEPQAGFRWERVERRGNDIVFAVDTSRSMLTPDVKPDRLTRAKLAIDDFVSRLDGDAVGLVAFAGTAFVQCPLTLDYDAFHESLSALDTHIIPRGGTDISSAIRAAQSAFVHRAASDRILILVTDGEDLEGDALATAKAAFKEDGLKIYTVGVGTAAGDLIPLPPEQGGGFLKDESGRFVRSRLDEPALRALAAATGGSYVPLGAANQGLDTIYREAIAPLVKHELQERSEKVYIERYQWPLAAALACLLASLVMGTRRRERAAAPAAAEPSNAERRPVEPALGPRGAASVSAALLALACLLPADRAHASPASAASAYRQGDFAKAQREYSDAAARDPGQPLLKFDTGTAAYKAGNYPLAAQEFKASLEAEKSGSAKRLAEQQDAYYDLGNALYREGERSEKSDVQRTIGNWSAAVKAYDAALQLRADDADSKFNRELVSRKLAELERQQNRQGQSQQQNQGGGSGQSKQQQGGGSGQSRGEDQGQTRTANNARPQGGQGPQSRPQPGQNQTPPQSAGQDRQKAGQTPQAAAQSGSQQNGTQQNGQQNRPQQSGPQQGGSAAGGAQMAQNRAGAREGDDQREPGEMSPEEARELLDSVKDEERRAPSAQKSQASSLPSEPEKDW